MEKKISATCECEGQVLLREQIMAVMVSSTSSVDSTTQLPKSLPALTSFWLTSESRQALAASFSIARLMRGTEYIGIDDNGVEFEIKKPDFYDFTALCMSHPTWPADAMQVCRNQSQI
jgi:hypothetical protein